MFVLTTLDTIAGAQGLDEAILGREDIRKGARLMNCNLAPN